MRAFAVRVYVLVQPGGCLKSGCYTGEVSCTNAFEQLDADEWWDHTSAVL